MAATLPYHIAPGAGHCHASGARRLKKAPRFLLCLVLVLIFILHRQYSFEPFSISPIGNSCRNLPGARDTVVVMKTGVTELEQRFPIHLSTTLTCMPNYLIFSDHEEMYEGKYRIRDVLAGINSTIREQNSDFALYRHVREVGREGLTQIDLTGERSTSKTSKADKVQIGGWVLDKWKFLPMMTETLALYPNKKWYVFMESDTFLFWTTTLNYVATLDHNDVHCLGHRSTVRSEYPFMHGGSGYVLSQAALRKTVAYIHAHQRQLDQFVASEWAGDIALGLVFKELGIPLTASWPIYQPHNFGLIDYQVSYEDKNFWCHPAGSYHHMTPDDIEDLWKFEQDWLLTQNPQNNPNSIVRHGDIFNNVLLPRMRFARDDWNNDCRDPRDDVVTLEDCEEACMDDESCVQYSFDASHLQCNTTRNARLGESAIGSGIRSSWLFDRVENWRNHLPACHGELFIYDAELS